MSKKMKVKVTNKGEWISFLTVGGRLVEVRISHGEKPPAEEVMAFILEKLQAEDK